MVQLRSQGYVFVRQLKHPSLQWGERLTAGGAVKETRNCGTFDLQEHIYCPAGRLADNDKNDVAFGKTLRVFHSMRAVICRRA